MTIVIHLVIYVYDKVTSMHNTHTIYKWTYSKELIVFKFSSFLCRSYAIRYELRKVLDIFKVFL